MMKFEYDVAESDTKKIKEVLNKLGEQGWELVAIRELSSTIIGLIVKRPVAYGTLALLT